MKRHAPSTERNRDAITQVLKQELPTAGTVLEIASGTGEHVVHFARLFPDLAWQPSDAGEDALQSIEAWRTDAGLANLRSPIHLDAAVHPWPVDCAAAMLCVNMLHISPIAATAGLFRQGARILRPNGPLLIYGPFVEPGVATAPSNVAFHADLVERNPEWGLRDRGDVEAMAEQTGFELARRYEVPANNLMLVFRRCSGAKDALDHPVGH